MVCSEFKGMPNRTVLLLPALNRWVDQAFDGSTIEGDVIVRSVVYDGSHSESMHNFIHI